MLSTSCTLTLTMLKYLKKNRKDQRVIFDFEIIIHVLVSSFRIDVSRRQILSTKVDPRAVRVKFLKRYSLCKLMRSMCGKWQHDFLI